MKSFFIKAVLSIICLLVWLPVILLLGNSLMSEGEMNGRYGVILGRKAGEMRGTLLPDYPTVRPYVDLLLDSPAFFVMFWNSWFQTVPVLAGQLLTAMPAAWALARFSFPGRRGFCILYIVLMILPFQVSMIPNYLVLKQFHLINHHLAVILPGIFAAFPVFIMMKFFESIPESLTEAARLDGAGEFMVFWRVGIPTGIPGVMSAVVLGFLESWNQIEQPMTFLKEQKLWPLSLYLPEITTDKAGVAFAASVVMMTPPVLLFLFGESYLEQGISTAGIKE